MRNTAADPRASLQQKEALIGDLVAGVARKFKTGLFLHGSGGTGKSYLVLKRLQELCIAYLLFNSRMTGKGLFSVLKDNPDALIVIEDVERITHDPHAQGVLRSALWSQPGHERIVTWTTASEGVVSVPFRGGIIMISNRPLANLPELQAMATRIETLQVIVTAGEMEARMLDIAAAGLRQDGAVLLDPEACREVTEYLLDECRRAGCHLDLRLQQKAFQTYRQWDQKYSANHWKDLVTASVQETATQFRHEPDLSSPEERKRVCRNAVRQIVATVKGGRDQEDAYRKLTGGSRADFYRRKREVETGEVDPEDADRPT